MRKPFIRPFLILSFFILFFLAASLLFSACVTRQIVLEECGTIIPLGPRSVPGGVQFAVVIKDETRAVSVVGNFNAWRPAEFFLTNTPALRLWSGFVPITGMEEFQFKYIRNGYDWRVDPTTETVSDGMGGKNSLFRFPATPQP
jgi:hypothetical protein